MEFPSSELKCTAARHLALRPTRACKLIYMVPTPTSFYLREDHWNTKQERRHPSRDHDLASLADRARVLRPHRMNYRVIPATHASGIFN